MSVLWVLPSAAANLHVDLSKLEFTRVQKPDGKTWEATRPAQAYDAKSHDVGWYSHDTVMGKPTLHYGAQNRATYAFGTGIPGSRGTVWTPALAIDPKLACSVSFIHSYALGDKSRIGKDKIRFSYSFDGDHWVDQDLPEPAVKIPWTTFKKDIPCQGHKALWLNWDFSTLDGEHNTGRGWNLKSLDLTQK